MDISVIITNYNYGIFLERCLRSCLSQHLPRKDFEVIVVDDASTDMSRQILEVYTPRVQPIYLEENRGVAYAANEGIKAANGRLVVRVDADDFINEYMLLIQSLFLSFHPEYFGVSVDYITVDPVGDGKLQVHSAIEEPVSCGIMYRKDIFVQEGLYNPAYRHREEMELRMRLDEKYRIANIPIPLYRYRQHDRNKSKSAEFHQMGEALTRRYENGDEEL